MFVIPKIDVIKNKRKMLGMSKHKLSIMAGLSGTAIYRIESGKTKKIHILRANEIAKALGCNISDIFKEEE